MKKLFTILFYGIGCGLLFITSAYSQAAADSAAPAQVAFENTVALFKQAAGAQLRLYNGSLYEGYRYAFKNGHPYFKSAEATAGSVVYDGVLYEKVPLRYDLLRDKVIVEHADEATQVSLVPEKIAAFTLHNHTFIHLSPDSGANIPLTAGFYDQLYQGQIAILAKRTTKVEQRTTPAGVERTLRPQVRYYLKQNNRYYPVKNLGGLMGKLKDKQKEIRLFVKQNNLRYADNLEDGLVKMAAYYDRIKN